MINLQSWGEELQTGCKSHELLGFHLLPLIFFLPASFDKKISRDRCNKETGKF